MNEIDVVDNFSNIQSIENVTIEKIEKLENVLLGMEQANIITEHTFL